MQTFPAKERYGIIRFIAFEYAAKYGPYSSMYFYLDNSGYPIMISTKKITIFNSIIKVAYLPTKLIILYCLYNEYKIESHLGLLLHISRILSKQKEEKYSEIIGVDVSSYRLLEQGNYEHKGA